MSKVLKVIAVIAGAVALIATGLGAIGVGTILGVSTTTIAAIAGVVAGVASFGSQLLARPPPPRGSVTQVMIATDAPQPYVMGEGLFAGVLRHDTAYGATLNDIPNPYRWLAIAYSGGGPVQSITPYVDQAAIGSWYSTFLYTSTKLGAQPDTALTPNFSGAPGWSTASKLSGVAAIGWNLKFDKDGKRFASGIPPLAAYGQWVKVYDPRLDSTFPGGSGAHRIGIETTYAWSENPALHAGTYAFGRFQNGKRTMGIGLPADAINWANIAAWANVCDANGWTIFGAIYEPGDRFANLREIAHAGGAEPVLAADLLSFHYAAPRIALDTVTEDDLADAELSVTAMQSWRDRLNTVIPKYRSPTHNWELVQANAVSVAGYVTEDGEVKQVEWPFNLVKLPDQAAELAAYRLVDSREKQPIELTVGPRLRAYRPGDRLDLVIPSLALNTPAVILRREFDPGSMTTRLTLIGETPAKHAFALGLTGTAPPTPAIGQTGQERDELAGVVQTTAQATITLAADKIVAADSAGAVTAGNLAALMWVPSVVKNGASIKLLDTTSYAISASYGGTFAVFNTNGASDKGNITISAITALTAGGVLTVTVLGVAQAPISFKVTKSVAAIASSAPGKLVSWSAGDFVGINTTSYTEVIALRTLALAAGETLYGTAPLDYYVATTNNLVVSREMTFKWQYSAAGAGIWNDFAAGIAGSTASSGTLNGAVEASPGSVAVTQSKAALGAGNYDVRMVAICSTTGRICTPTGTATVEAKV